MQSHCSLLEGASDRLNTDAGCASAVSSRRLPGQPPDRFYPELALASRCGSRIRNGILKRNAGSL